MSNATQPFGLRPVRYMTGSPWNGATVKCFVSADYATALFIGDPIIISPTAGEDDTTNTNYYPKINRATADDDGATDCIIRGVIVSFDPSPTLGLQYVYNPASTERIANVVMDYNVIYQIRGDGAGTPATDWISRNACCTSGSGSTVTGLSGFLLDEGTESAPESIQADPLEIVGIAHMPDNTLADYCIWEVRLNTHFNTTGMVLGVSDA